MSKGQKDHVAMWLVTGGAGYIGAHVVRALVANGYRVVVLDDFSTGEPGRLPCEVESVTCSLLDKNLKATMEPILSREPFEGLIHLAAKKSVPDSLRRPLYYFEQNVVGTARLLELISTTKIRKIVYSSTAAVYGDVTGSMVHESTATLPKNPYGESKLSAEWMIKDYAEAVGIGWAALRYFNVAGASSERLSDRAATSLIPLVRRAARTGEPLKVFGADWPTRDGSCIRDYVHVEDLANAHVAAAVALDNLSDRSVGPVNIGRGEGVSVLEMISAVERALDRPVPYKLVGRRLGDPASVVADPERARQMLGWSANKGLQDMVRW